MAPLVAARDAEQSRPGGGQNSGEAGADLGGGRPDLRRWLDFCGERGSCGRGRGLLFPTGPLLFGSIRAAKNLGATPPRQSKFFAEIWNAPYYQALQEDILQKLMSRLMDQASEEVGGNMYLKLCYVSHVMV
ncbi:unnamed protein product [Urochloa humidicola]